jgi:hypothetical protein
MSPSPSASPVPSPKFTIRPNQDKTLDVICMKCFMTAGSTYQAIDPDAIMRAHVCNLATIIDFTNHFYSSWNIVAARMRSREPQMLTE